MKYRLTIKASAQRELVSLPNATMRRLDEAILRLADTPRPPGATKLTGVPLYRVRVGSYRIVYEIDDRKRHVDIVGIGHRREVYR